METIRLAVQLQKKDYLRAYRRHFWRTIGWIVPLASLSPLIPILRARRFISELSSGDIRAIAVAAALAIAVGLFMALALETCARMFSQHAIRKTPLALQPQVLTFSVDGLQTETPSSSGSVRWNAFAKATVSSWAFQLHLGPGQYLLIPFEQVASPSVKDELRTMFKQHLGERAKFRA